MMSELARIFKQAGQRVKTHAIECADRNWILMNRDRILLWAEQIGKTAEVKAAITQKLKYRIEIQHSVRTAFSRTAEHAHFVWVYWRGAAEADEILWSIRSVKANYIGEPSVTVIGDRPEGFDGHVMHQQRVRKQPFHRFRDTLAKMETLATTKDLPSEIVWSMDDCYFLKQGFSLKDLTPKVATPKEYRGQGDWPRMNYETVSQLEASGYETKSYVSHLPQVVNREKLKTIFEMFDFRKTPMCWESLYGNVFYPNAEDHKKTLLRIADRPVTARDCETAKHERVVLNHHHGSWSKDLKNWLSFEFGGL